MLEQLNDKDRFGKIMRKREFLLPRSDGFTANPLSMRALIAMANLEPNQKQVWIKPRDFADRIKNISGIIITENSLLYEIAIATNTVLIPYNTE